VSERKGEERNRKNSPNLRFLATLKEETYHFLSFSQGKTHKPYKLIVFISVILLYTCSLVV